MTTRAADFIDTARYPVDLPGGSRDALIAQLRTQLDHDGCAVLKGFVRADALVD